MGFNNIEKKDLWYSFAKKFFVSPWHNFVYYRKIHINHKELIPKNSHLIFTPNHENALMDAIAPLCNIKMQLVFLARSDIFKKKKIASILYFLKILPIFRIRDGYGSVKKNNETFLKTIDVIKADNGLVILPEGDYVRKNQLRPLKKGFARIAFQTEESNDFKLNLKIVPLGLHYDDYDEIRGKLIINVGHPIPVSEYTDLYKESPAVAINQLTARLTQNLSPLMLDIKEENYETVKSLLSFHRPLSKDLSVEQKLAGAIEDYASNHPEDFNRLENNLGIYNSILKKSGINKKAIECKLHKSSRLIVKTFIMLLGLPLFIIGALNNLLPYITTETLAGRVKDVNFKHSFRFVISLVVFVIFYIIQIIAFGFISGSIWVALIYAIFLPFSLVFSIDYLKQFRLIFSGWKLFWFKLNNVVKAKELLSTHEKLTDFIKSLS